MGNANGSSGVALGSGLRRLQEDKTAQSLYKLVDLHGGGELLPWVKFAKKSGDASILEGLFEAKVKKYIYNDGKGKLVTVAELVKKRNDERNAFLSALNRKKGKGKAGPNVLEGLDQDMMQGDMMKALKFLDGGGKGGKGGGKYREMVWDTNQRGAIGENLLIVCLLQGTGLHNQLAKYLVEHFPKLVNDICLSEDYYGFSALHQAIANEDPEMVRYLINNGADLHQRCYGAFYCPDDQRESRADSLEHEWLDVNPKTKYTGHTYWGEYPLSFAACAQQEDCVRLLRARKTDINMRDTNGNTVLHMMVIHDLPDMFDLCYKLGGKLHITNNQNFTPLTLAAFLANKKMFDHVLTIEREVEWTYGGVTCAAYPLAYIDTIDQSSGELNKDSALGLIVHGETNAHLDLIDGMMEDLLQQKWLAFAKSRLLRKFLLFCLYFSIFFFAFYMRNFYGTGTESEKESQNTNLQIASEKNLNGTDVDSEWIISAMNGNTSLLDNITTTTTTTATTTTTEKQPNALSKFCKEREWEFCVMNDHLWSSSGPKNKARLILEGLTLFAVLIQIVSGALDIKRTSWKSYYKIMLAFPALFIYRITWIVVLFMVFFRIGQLTYIENILGFFAALGTGIHFLYFCRGIKFVGPVVLMVYKIIVGDMMRFFIIYGVFVFGFSQSFFIIFADCDRGKNMTNITFTSSMNQTKKNILPNAFEAVVRSFIMSIGEFAVFYTKLHDCNMSYIGKLLFIVFELCVSIMLINLLIAMMARTYDEIAKNQREWKRQWAKVIVTLEESLQPKDRLVALLKYSRPIGTNKSRRAFVVKWHLEKEEVSTAKNERLERMKSFIEERRIAMKRRLQEEEGGSLTSRRPSFMPSRMDGLIEN